jgi:MFS family permease
MGKTMGLLGVSGLLSSIIVPALSDKIGRKPVMFVFMALGVLYPLAVYAWLVRLYNCLLCLLRIL